VRLGDARDGNQLIEPSALVIAAQCAFRKKIHGDQDAEQQP
jgi:hypothetical protein